ncbi:amino acid adenylation domain-containing protein [Micromonospora sp. WMMD730]|uniref:amino acid adenylation domain-containing protein n=1 Tax=Micromonospora sp. WMMD730 TaxID=3404128 RepID=UPI003B95BD98
MRTTPATTDTHDPGEDAHHPPAATLPDLLDEQVRADPDAVAVRHGPDGVTRRELARRARALAAQLRERGAGPDDRVGLFAEPSAGLVVGAWGILYASAAYLPLAPDYPDERLRYMAADARIRLVVAQDDLVERLTDLVPPDTAVVPLSAWHDTSPPDVPDHRPRPRDLAYVIYTSGSTGRPKGVMIEHRSIVSQLRWLRDTYRLDEAVVLQKTPMSFDAAQWEILAPACGGTVVAGTPGLHRDPEAIIASIRRHGVTALQCVPTLLRALVDTERLGTCTSLRQVFTGGEALSTTLAADVLKAHPATLVNLYGPTECTINSSAFTVDPAGLDPTGQSVSIGRPVTGLRYVIVDADDAPVTGDAVGELLIGGIQLARGYLHRPALTAQRFVPDPVTGERLYRTGDLAAWQDDGTVRFVGRVDNQVKLRGFRVELDEVRLAVEAHQWVRHAGVLVRDDPRTGHPHLLAVVELNPREAALMDQGHHGAHHRSKESRLQVRAQLSHVGVRTPQELTGRPVLALPGAEPTAEQVRRVFARKTYRFYEGPPVTHADLLALLRPARPDPVPPRPLGQLDLATFGEIVRYLGQFVSDERLLPKYGYASPGALNATQVYLELHHLWGQPSGYYYHHPLTHELVLISPAPPRPEPTVRLHLVGRRRAIEPVYQDNIREVLEIETGHLVGLLEQVLPGYGLGITATDHAPQTIRHLDCAAEDLYLGSFAVTPYAPPPRDEIDLYVQVHPDRGVDLPAGQYRYHDGELVRLDDALVQRQHVIAINQQVYDRAAIGISMISTTSTRWRRYVDLGRVLQRLSMNDGGFGFMSSGYSSDTGHDLPSAHRIRGILRRHGLPDGPSYFAVGGRVSAAQVAGRGMKEDVVHMKGPAELIRDDLAGRLPDYMLPNKVVILDRMPLTANGKTDLTALAARVADDTGPQRPFVAPRTDLERRIARLWAEAVRQDDVSVHDDFFACGGNSLIAVALINRLNRVFGAALPMQVIFDNPTVAQLARRVAQRDQVSRSRLVPLARGREGRSVYCWPGLGGYPMNLRLLAGTAGRPFHGVQAYGVNPGEEPYRTISRMAAEDIRAIRERQPRGPYTLWGYSFGTRVAVEAAYQLEQAGEQVDQLVLIAPGSPRVRVPQGPATDGPASFANPTYLAVLCSVFAGTVTGPVIDECLATVTDEETFTGFVQRHFPALDLPLVRRITRVVARTYGLRHTEAELARRPVRAPVTVLRTRGDQESFLDTAAARRNLSPVVVDLAADHYGVLREPGVHQVVAALPARSRRRPVRPHVSISHLPIALTDEQHNRLVTAVTRAMTRAFGCDEDAVSVALEAVLEE